MKTKAETMKKVYIVLAIIYTLYAIAIMITSAKSTIQILNFDISPQTLLILTTDVLSYLSSIVSICFLLLRFTLYNKRDDRHKFFSLSFIITGLISITSTFFLQLGPYIRQLIIKFTYSEFENIDLKIEILSILIFFLVICTNVLSFFVAYELITPKKSKIFSKIFIVFTFIILLLHFFRNCFIFPFQYAFFHFLFALLNVALLTVAIFDIDNKATIQTEEIATEPQTDATETQADITEPQTDITEEQ